MFALNKLAFAFGLGLIACSASSPPENPAPSPSPDKSASPTPTPAATTPAQPLPNATSTAPAPSVTTSSTASTTATPQCTKAAEPNHDQGHATAFTDCFTGALAGWTDVAVFKITAPQGAATMQIAHQDPDGVINYTVTSGGGAGGSSNMSFSAQAPTTNVTPGTTYYFTLKWDNDGNGAVDDTRGYTVRVAFLH